jgi:DNA-binding CsgD family transcriptional regulator
MASVMSSIEQCVPSDRGVSLMRMDGLIPHCLRWPEYSSPLIPRFNSYFNVRSPLYYRPPFRVLPSVDWRAYDDSEYHNEFNRPLNLRYSIGIGIRDEAREIQYTLFVHRGTSGPAFSERDHATLAVLWRPLNSILSLVCDGDSLGERVRRRETDEGCEILSPREREIAGLLCRRYTMRRIAATLGISPRTVERHALHVYQKLNVSGKRELIRICSQ